MEQYNRIESLKRQKINHRNWQNAVSESFALLTVVSAGEVVNITGPSQAGKTRLIKELVRLLCGEDRFSETGLMPAVVVDAENTGPNGVFSTKAFTHRMLEATQHPVLSVSDEQFTDSIAYQKFDRTTEAMMRRALESAFKRRGTRYLFIDEVQHARFVSKGAQGAFAVLDSWKCMAKAADLVLVLVGAYPILDILYSSPHMVGRKYQVHLPRYKATKEDLKDFAGILATYDDFVVFDKSMSSLVDYVELLHSGSFGCIGLLRKWLINASAIAVARGIKLSVDLLTETKMPVPDLESIETEIVNGERYLSCVVNRQKKSGDGLSKIEGKAKTERKPRKGGKPFQRNPKRLKAGNRTTG